jgi:hypothetical protein
LFIVVIAGATAVGGGDLIVVVLVLSVVLLDVLSVTIGCADTVLTIAARITDIAILFILTRSRVYAVLIFIGCSVKDI